MIDARGSGATRLEARMVAAEVSLTFVAARLRRILQDGPEISQPSVRLSGRCVIVGFVVDGAEPLTPALMRALVEIRRAADTTGLPAASRLRLAGVDVLERSPRHCQEWSWEELRQRAVDENELRSILRWPRVSRLHMELEHAVEEAVRRADAHARLDEALRRL